ncbi:basic-leucine zipper transcription factor A-like [Cloeon dipterum]|uniref:basic-leucine zipper transcription factor A-like n=1 Tax=Cloeon dipterum TaxID=197152 RepID=UPI00321FD68B
MHKVNNQFDDRDGAVEEYIIPDVKCVIPPVLPRQQQMLEGLLTLRSRGLFDCGNAPELDAGKKNASDELVLPDDVVRQLHEMLPLNVGLELCDQDTAPVQQQPASRSSLQKNVASPQQMSPAHAVQVPFSPMQMAPKYSQAMASPVTGAPAPSFFPQQQPQQSSPAPLPPQTGQQQQQQKPPGQRPTYPRLPAYNLTSCPCQQCNYQKYLGPQQQSQKRKLQTKANKQQLQQPPPLPAPLPPRSQDQQCAQPQPTPNYCYTTPLQKPEPAPGQRLRTGLFLPAGNPPSYPGQVQQCNYQQDRGPQQQSQKRKQQTKSNKQQRQQPPPLPATLPPKYQDQQCAQPQPTPNYCYTPLQKPEPAPGQRLRTGLFMPAGNPPSYPGEAQQCNYPQDRGPQQQSRKRKLQTQPNEQLKNQKLSKEQDQPQQLQLQQQHKKPPPPSYQQHQQLYHGQPMMDHPIRHHEALPQQQCHFPWTVQQQGHHRLILQEIRPQGQSSMKKDQSYANQQQPTPPSNQISYRANITFAPMALAQGAKAVLPPHSNMIVNKLKHSSSLL